MKKNNITFGLVLIAAAIIMMGNSMGLIPDIPWFRILCSVLLAGWGIKAILERDFFGMFMSVSIIAWLFDDELGIDNLAPFPLLVAAACLGIGLNMIFGKKKKEVNIEYSVGGEGTTFSSEGSNNGTWTDGRHVTLENNFNSTSKYVNSAAFSSAKLENNFGSANVYFNNANVYNGEATIELNNNFGKMNIYLPSKWRASISQESTFGHVSIHGEPNRDMDAPYVIIRAESNFGELNIFFE